MNSTENVFSLKHTRRHDNHTHIISISINIHYWISYRTAHSPRTVQFWFSLRLCQRVFLIFKEHYFHTKPQDSVYEISAKTFGAHKLHFRHRICQTCSLFIYLFILFVYLFIYFWKTFSATLINGSIDRKKSWLTQCKSTKRTRV